MIVIYDENEIMIEENNVEDFFLKYRIPSSAYISRKEGQIIPNDAYVEGDEKVSIYPVRNYFNFDVIFHKEKKKHVIEKIQDEKCVICKKKPMTYKKLINSKFQYVKKYYCKECYISELRKKINKEIDSQLEINDEDSFLVPISGGKDGISELYLLKQYLFDKKINNKIYAYTAVISDNEYEKYNLEIAKKICRQFGIQHIVIYAQEVGKNINKMDCYNCSRIRRTIEEILVQILNPKVVLSGKNRTDINRQKLFMKFFSTSTCEDPKKKDGCKRMSLISQLSDYETALLLSSLDIEYGKHDKYECPYSDSAIREKQTIIAEIMEEYFPDMIAQCSTIHPFIEDYLEVNLISKETDVYAKLYDVVKRDIKNA